MYRFACGRAQTRTVLPHSSTAQLHCPNPESTSFFSASLAHGLADPHFDAVGYGLRSFCELSSIILMASACLPCRGLGDKSYSVHLYLPVMSNLDFDCGWRTFLVFPPSSSASHVDHPFFYTVGTHIYNALQEVPSFSAPPRPSATNPTITSSHILHLHCLYSHDGSVHPHQGSLLGPYQ